MANSFFALSFPVSVPQTLAVCVASLMILCSAGALIGNQVRALRCRMTVRISRTLLSLALAKSSGTSPSLVSVSESPAVTGTGSVNVPVVTLPVDWMNVFAPDGRMGEELVGHPNVSRGFTGRFRRMGRQEDCSSEKYKDETHVESSRTLQTDAAFVRDLHYIVMDWRASFRVYAFIY